MRGARGAPRETRNGSPDCEIQPFDKRRLNCLNSPREPSHAKGTPIRFWCAELDDVTDGSDAAMAVMFDNLGVEQLGGDDPNSSPPPNGLDPRAEVSCKSVKIERQAIAGEGG